MTTDQPTSGNGAPTPTPGDDAAQPSQINVLAQYVKDLSFENPNAPDSLREQKEQPNLQLEVNVAARPIDKDIYESSIRISAHAKTSANTIYQLELVYAGAFQLTNIPEEALQPVLLINCPTLLFPFARRIAGEMTIDGGFPPLLLDPIDFHSIYAQNAEKAKKQTVSDPKDAPAS